jgi:hypothetical protein
MADVAGFVVQDSIHADRVSRHGKSDDRWTKSRQLAADALAAFGRPSSCLAHRKQGA